MGWGRYQLRITTGRKLVEIIDAISSAVHYPRVAGETVLSEPGLNG